VDKNDWIIAGFIITGMAAFYICHDTLLTFSDPCNAVNTSNNTDLPFDPISNSIVMI
jgi:hypothetical protein